MEITRNRIRQINADIEKALWSVAEKHGVEISVGNSSFTDVEYTTKLTVKTEGSEQREREQSREYAKMLGLPEGIVGRDFVMRGETCKVVRIDPKKRKYPVIIKKPNGKKYKVTVESVKMYLKS